MLFCEDVELMLQDYLDGYLLPSQREVLESQLDRRDRAVGDGKAVDRIPARRGVATTVAAGNIQARLQLALADLVLVNKTGLVTPVIASLIILSS